MTGIDTDTIRWSDGRIHHRQSAFPELETVETGTGTVSAYRDRPGSLDDLLADAIRRAPDREAVVFPEYGVRLTYDGLDQRVDAVAATLVENGVEQGDTVAMMLSNRPAFVETFFACQRLGAIVAPINTRVSTRELAYLLDDADPVCVVSEPKFDGLFDEIDAVPPLLDVAADGFERTDSSDAPTVPAVEVSEHDPAAIIYTSGTTGHPKGCITTGFHLVNGALNYRTAFETDEGLRSLAVVPLFHVAGLTSNLLHTISVAGTTIVRDSTGPNELLETIENERVEYMLGVPTNYVLAMEQGSPEEYDLSSWEIAAYGGAPMPAGAIGRLRDAFPHVSLSDAYGTSETVGGLVTMCPDQYTDTHADTIGLPSPPVELAVLENGERQEPGSIGELVIRGPIVIQEYYNRPDETAEAFDEDGWYHTGDLASISADGFVELKGRDRDKIVRGGENIYALDIEEVLTDHPDVLEASVTSFPDAVLGERVLAAVSPKPEARLTEDALVEHCEARLADYKVPEVFRILDELPKNPGGKVLKSEIVPEPLEHGIRASRD